MSSSGCLTNRQENSETLQNEEVIDQATEVATKTPTQYKKYCQLPVEAREDRPSEYLRAKRETDNRLYYCYILHRDTVDYLKRKDGELDD